MSAFSTEAFCSKIVKKVPGFGAGAALFAAGAPRREHSASPRQWPNWPHTAHLVRSLTCWILAWRAFFCWSVNEISTDALKGTLEADDVVVELSLPLPYLFLNTRFAWAMAARASISS